MRCIESRLALRKRYVPSSPENLYGNAFTSLDCLHAYPRSNKNQNKNSYVAQRCHPLTIQF